MPVRCGCLLMERGAAIKQRAKQAEIEGSISGHSLRTGSAISLAQAGAGILAARSASAFVYQYLYCHTNVW